MAEPSASDWRLRPLRPSDLLVRGLGLARGQASSLAELIVMCLGAAIIGWYFLLAWPPLVALCILTAAGTGVLLAWQVHHGTPVRGVTTGRAVLATAVVSNAGWGLLLLAHQPRVAALLSLGAAEVFTRRPAGRKTEPWWSHNRIATALVTAKAVPAVKTPGMPDSLPSIGYIGKGRDDDTGVWRTFRLPPGSTWQDVRKRHPALASAMNIPEARLHVEHDPEQPANAVTIAVLADHTDRPTPPISLERTDWTQPVLLGPDRLGRPVHLQTQDTHTVFVGQTGSGKTNLARRLVAAAILDPNVPIMMISGKDDEEDWQPMRPRCDRYVGGTTRQSVEQALALLQEVERLSEERGRQRKDQRQPMVLVLDEFYRLSKRAEAYDPALAKTLVSLMGELGATVRSRNIHMIFTFQRGTVSYIDPDLRANLPQKAVGMTAKEAETRYVLDLVPQALPTRPGEFLVSVEDREPTLIRVPLLDDAAFAEVCRVGIQLRGQTPDEEAGRTPTAVPGDPFEEAVLGMLADGPKQASVIFAGLDEQLRPKTDAVLGKALARMDGVQKTWSGERRNTAVWSLAPTSLPPAVPTGSTRIAGPAVGNSPRHTPLQGVGHAQTGSLSLVPPAPPEPAVRAS